MGKTSRLDFIISLTDKISGPLNRIENLIGGFTSRIGAEFGRVFKWGSAAIGGFVGFSTNSLINLQRELNATAQAFNISQQSMQLWQAAGVTVGIEGDKMTDIMKDVNDKVGDFLLTGGGEAKDLFETLKLDVNTFKDMTPDQMILEIGAALDTSNLTKSEKIFLLEGLADDASRLLPLLENNADKLLQISNTAIDSGAILTKADTAVLSEATEQVGKIKLAMQGLTTQAGLIGAHFVNAFGDDIAGAIRSVSTWVRDAWRNTEGLRFGLMYLGSGVWEQLLAFAKGIATGFKEAVKPIFDMITPAGNLVRQLFAMGNALDDSTGNARYYGEIAGKALAWIIGGVIALKAAIWTLIAVQTAAKVAQIAWNVAMVAGRVAMLAMVAGSALLQGGLALLMSPIGLVIAGVALLVAGAVWLYKNWEKVKTYLADTSWGAPLAAAMDMITSPVETFNRITDKMGALWRGAKTSLSDTVWGTVLSAALDALLLPFRLLKLAFTATTGGWDAVKASLSDTAWGQSILALIDSISAGFQKLADGWNTVKGFAAEKVGGVKAFFGFGDAAKDGGARALGGTVLPGHFYRVNEHGPELLQTMGQTFLMTGGAAGNIVPFPTQAANSESFRELATVTSLSDRLNSSNTSSFTNNSTNNLTSNHATSTSTERLLNTARELATVTSLSDRLNSSNTSSFTSNSTNNLTSNHAKNNSTERLLNTARELATVTSLSDFHERDSSRLQLQAEPQRLNVRSMLSGNNDTSSRRRESGRPQKVIQIQSVHIHTPNKIDPQELRQQLEMLA